MIDYNPTFAQYNLLGGPETWIPSLLLLWY